MRMTASATVSFPRATNLDHEERRDQQNRELQAAARRELERRGRLAPPASDEGDNERQTDRARQQKPRCACQVRGDELGLLGVRKPDLDDELRQHCDERNDREYEATGEDSFSSVRRPREQERSCDQSDRKANRRGSSTGRKGPARWTNAPKAAQPTAVHSCRRQEGPAAR